MNIDKLYNMFDADPQLDCELDHANHTLIIRAKNSGKARAIERLIDSPKWAEFGVPRVVVIDTCAEVIEYGSYDELLILAGEGNPAFDPTLF